MHDDARLQTFGQRLKYLRQRRGLKQRDLARLIDKPQSSISSYEADERSPTLQTVQILAVALGCSVSMLIGEADDGIGELPATNWSQQLYELNGYISQLPPYELEDMLTTLRVLVALRLERVEHERQHKRPRKEREEPQETTY